MEMVSFSCAWSAVGDRIDVSELRLAVDDSLLNGKVSVLGRNDPHFDLDLHLNDLNLDRYSLVSAPRDGEEADTSSAKSDEMPFAALRELNLNATLALDVMTASNLKASDVRLRLSASEG